MVNFTRVLGLLVCLSIACGAPDSASNSKPELAAEESALTASVALSNNVQVANLSGSRSSKKSYTFAVPDNATNLKFQMSGGSGDADIYVRFGAAPTTSTYDYRPYIDGNDETVTPSASTAGTWYIMVRGYSAYSGLALVASYEIKSDGSNDGENNNNNGGQDGNSNTAIDCTNSATWPASWVAFEDGVLALVNQRRAAGATCGGVSKPAVGALVMDEALRKAARCHSLDLANHNYFDHNSQDGRSPWDRIRAAGYTAFGNAENIAAGQTSPEDVMSSWMNSTGHCNNIMSDGSNEIGIGYAYDESSDYDRYWTQDFGVR